MNELERLVSVLAACEHPAVLIQELRTTTGDPIRRCLQCGAISHTEAETGWKPWAPPVLVVLVCEEARKEAKEIPAPTRAQNEDGPDRQQKLIDAALADARRAASQDDMAGFRELKDAFRSLDSALSAGQPLPRAWSRTSHEDLFREYLLLHQRARLAAIDRDTCMDSIIGILPPAQPKPITYTTAPPGETPGATARRWAEEDRARPVEGDRALRPIVRAMCPHCDHPISRHNLPGSPGALGTGCLVDGCKCKREAFTAAERDESSIAGETAKAERWAAEDRAQRDSLGPARMVGHILYGPRALCGFMAEREPRDWPPGHYFVTLKQVTWSNSSGHGKVSIPPEFKFEPCAECVRRAEESIL